ncbi:MAG TPA: hypothetical protein VGK67_30970 [Myxococcales bacterium]|jgi:hypothetical protein
MNRALALALASCVLAGCSSAASTYRPSRVLPTELNVRYDDAFLVFAGNKQVAEGPRFEGLTDFVHCVPDARRHAESAEGWGSTAGVLKGFTFAFSGAGLGGLAGLGFKDKDDTAMAALLISGVVLEGVAIALGAISLGAKAQASGHALDAVNYYNDSAGSLGGMCQAR